jgi:predicted MPP superfamily phosphohydrolase
VAGLVMLGVGVGAPDGAWHRIALGYALFCGVVGCGGLGTVTWLRWRRRPPPAILERRSRTLDVSQRLGYRPVGEGRGAWLAHLPGNELFRVELAEHTLALPRLPRAWEDLSILHISDLHYCGTPGLAFFEHLMEVCSSWEPDIVAVTGDVLDDLKYQSWIAKTLGQLRWRVAGLAILGNHDRWHDPALVRQRLREAGLQVLGNSWRQIEVRGEPLMCIGHEGPWFRPEPDLTFCPREPFRLCLSHTPDNIDWARSHAVDLMLSGHNHGGQVRLPGLGSLLVPSRYGRRYDSGIFAEPPTLLHVSRGLGEDQPLRYHCRPEVTRITLRSCPSATALGPSADRRLQLV